MVVHHSIFYNMFADASLVRFSAELLGSLRRARSIFSPLEGVGWSIRKFPFLTHEHSEIDQEYQQLLERGEQLMSPYYPLYHSCRILHHRSVKMLLRREILDGRIYLYNIYSDDRNLQKLKHIQFNLFQFLIRCQDNSALCPFACLHLLKMVRRFLHQDESSRNSILLQWVLYKDVNPKPSEPPQPAFPPQTVAGTAYPSKTEYDCIPLGGSFSHYLNEFLLPLHRKNSQKL
jgi:hypothetical protein